MMQARNTMQARKTKRSACKHACRQSACLHTCTRACVCALQRSFVCVFHCVEICIYRRAQTAAGAAASTPHTVIMTKTLPQYQRTHVAQLLRTSKRHQIPIPMSLSSHALLLHTLCMCACV